MNGFTVAFGRPPTVLGDAPGRVNLIGEHTDYNDGFVLPVATRGRTRVALAPSADARVRVASASTEPAGRIATWRLGAEVRRGDWTDHVAGVTWALARAGAALRGVDAWIDSDLPLGAGLASSAALAVAVTRALRAAFALPLDDLAVARLAHRAEHDFVGARVGIMDQMAACFADERTALHLDCRALTFERVPLPTGLELVVVDSGIRHRNVGGGYARRRHECEQAAAALGVRALRDVPEADLPRVVTLPPPLDRRARHVVTENARVGATVRALRAGDLATVGRLFDASHASQRDDFAVSLPEIDLLVDLLRAAPGVLGVRLGGGGFGGAILAGARPGAGRPAAERALAPYAARTGRAGRVLACSR